MEMCTMKIPTSAALPALTKRLAQMTGLLGLLALLLAGCGGGEADSALAVNQVNSPRPLALAATLSGNSAVVMHLHQALYGTAPSLATYNSHLSELASKGDSAFAASLVANFASISNTDLAKLVLDNLGINSSTVKAVNAQGQSEYTVLLDALGQLFGYYGASARGQIILNATNLLAGLESDATWGAAAAAYNMQTASNLDSMSALPVGFAIGTKTATTVSSSSYKEVVEPVSGYTFVFPSGGSGTLNVAPITTAPDRPVAGGVGFNIEYSGSESMKVKIPTSAGDQLLGYGMANGSIDDGLSATNRWIAIAGDDSQSGYRLFDLGTPGVSASATKNSVIRRNTTAPRNTYKGYSQYWITQLSPTDNAKRVAIGLQAALDVENWLNVLPPSLQTAARAATSGRLRYREYYDGNYYIGFTRRLLGNTTTPMLGLKLDTDAQIIAHEVGHYMNHVLVGDALYLALEDTAPDENHGIGVAYPGRTTILEDYAYFSQYFLTGSIGSADPTNPRTVLGAMNPATVDIPSVEGFASILLASLNRSNASIVGLVSKAAENVPVAGVSFGDIASIIARGAPNINVLRSYIEEYLTAKEQDGKLPAIVERIGWTYGATGTVLDASGKPLAGASVEAISKDGSTVYTMPSANKQTSASDGTFTLPRVFPGKSFIRVTLGTDVFDVPITVDWDKPTTERIALGNLATTLNNAQTSSWNWAEKYLAIVLNGGNQIQADAFVSIVGDKSSFKGTPVYYGLGNMAQASYVLAYLRQGGIVPTTVSMSITPSAQYTDKSWFSNGWEYKLKSIGCRVTRKPSGGGTEVEIGSSCSQTDRIDVTAAGRIYRMYISYLYTGQSEDVDPVTGARKFPVETYQGEGIALELTVY